MKEISDINIQRMNNGAHFTFVSNILARAEADAAVISPVGEIDNKVYGADETVTFPAGYTEIGPVMKKLRETLTGIQSGAVEDKHNWVYTVA